MQVGDIVILQDDGLKRNEWRTGIIEKASESSDGLVRKVTIRLANQTLDRSGKPMLEATRLERAAQKVVVLVPMDK